MPTIGRSQRRRFSMQALRPEKKREKYAWIHSVQTFGTVDGPGIRTVFFFQGCPYRCAYCHNPDTWSFWEGTYMSLSSLLVIAEENRPFFADGGGITISGGECLFQADFLISFLRECRRRRIHTAIDTSGMSGLFHSGGNNGSVPPFPKAGTSANKKRQKISLFREADLVLLDVKFTSEEKYRKYTAGSLSEVLDTLSMLQEMQKPVWVREVIIPGVNDTIAEMRRLKQLLRPSAVP